MKPAFPRTLTVTQQAITTTAAWYYSKTRFVPAIRLAAAWLEQAGFKPGDKVEVSCDEQGKLVIQKKFD